MRLVLLTPRERVNNPRKAEVKNNKKPNQPEKIMTIKTTTNKTVIETKK